MVAARSEVDTVTILYSCQTSFTFLAADLKGMESAYGANMRQNITGLKKTVSKVHHLLLFT